MAAHLGNRSTVALAAEVERHLVARSRGWVVGLGRLCTSWSRTMESYVYLTQFEAHGSKIDLGAGFSFEPGTQRAAIRERVAAVRDYVCADGADGVMQERWVAQLVQSCQPHGAALPNTLEQDLISLYCSNHALCYGCLLPMGLRGTARALTEDEAFRDVLDERGVGYEEDQPPNSVERRLAHEECSGRHTPSRLALGRTLLLDVARVGVE